MGSVQGIPVCFDAKETTKKSLPLSNIHRHQIEFMENFSKQRGIAFIIAYFHIVDRCFFIPLEDLKHFWERAQQGGKKSISYQEFNPDFLVQKSKGIYLHYLEALNRYLVQRSKVRGSMI